MQTETKTIINFIEKCINDTKNNKLHWEVLPSNSKLQNHQSINSTEHTLFNFSSYDFKTSYYTQFKNSFFFLRTAFSPVSISSTNNDCILLYVQNDSSSFSELIASSMNNNSNINILLKRLFIIVDTQIKSPETVINDFLNS